MDPYLSHGGINRPLLVRRWRGGVKILRKNQVISDCRSRYSVHLLPDIVYGSYVLYVRPLGRCRYEPTKIATLSADLMHPILQTIQ